MTETIIDPENKVTAKFRKLPGKDTAKKYGTVGEWTEASGMTRSGTYLAIKSGKLRAIKQPGGRRTLIDFESGWGMLAEQPAIGAGKPPDVH